MNNEISELFANARLEKKPLILDGSMGALLSQMGFTWDPHKWMTDVIETSPETIIMLHQAYINAGADIITTNTFRTNPIVLGKDKSKLFVKKACNLAKKATEESLTIIAGSNPPAEDCYKKIRNIRRNKLEINHCNHIDLLQDNEVDFILNETLSHKDEIEIICNYCSNNSIPFVISLFFDDDLKILSGETIFEIIKLIREHNPIAVGFNCMQPSTFKRFMHQLVPEHPWGFYLNCGAGKITDTEIKCGISPTQYSNIVAEYTTGNPLFIGACCGSSPEHIKQLKLKING